MQGGSGLGVAQMHAVALGRALWLKLMTALGLVAIRAATSGPRRGQILLSLVGGCVVGLAGSGRFGGTRNLLILNSSILKLATNGGYNTHAI